MEKGELYDTFVARERLLSELLDTISDNTGKKSIQHIILLGARGIGKTNMLRMVENKVLDSPQLRNKWITVNIPEEQYGIFGIVDFFKYILEIILHSTQLENVDKKVYQKELDDIELSRQKESIDKLVSILKDISRGENKQFLLLVDNIDKILAEKITVETELEYLRSILMTDNFIMILGTSTSIFEEIALYNKAFFRFFKTIHLQNLNDKEVEELLLKRAKFDGIIDKIKLDENKNKIKAITDLTGGYPRLVLMLYEILEDKPLLDVLKTFNKLLDNLTPYYKHRMDDLAPQQQKIIDTIMLSDGVASPTDVANKVGWKPTVVTSQFTRLKDLSILQVKEDGGTKKKKSLYEISDKLFVIWYQMRYLGVLKRRIEYIVTFLKIWYDLEGLKDKVSVYALQYQQRYSIGNYSESYDYARSISIMSCAISETGEKEKIHYEQFKRYLDIGKFEDALKELEELLRIDEGTSNKQGIASDYSNMGIVFQIRGDVQKALDHHEKSLKIYEKIGNKKGIANAYGNMGNVFLIQGDVQKTLDNYEKSLKIYEEIRNRQGIADQFDKMGVVFEIQGDLQKALDHHEKALKIYEEIGNKKGIANAYGNMGNVFQKQRDLQKALDHHEKALKIYEEIGYRESMAKQLANLGVAFVKLGDLQKALNRFEKAIKIHEEIGANLYLNVIMNNKINLLFELSIKNNKEKNIGKALENLEEIAESLTKTKNETSIKIIVTTIFELLIDTEYDFAITILETLRRKHEDIFEICEPFMISAQYLKTKDHSILENTSSIVLEGVNKILDAVEKQKLNRVNV